MSTPPCPDRHQLADAFFYGPVGLVLDAQTVAPDLAKRGRQHVRAARVIGEFAVKTGFARLNGLLEPAGGETVDTAAPPSTPEHPGNEPKSQPKSQPESGPAIDPDDLPIPRYDTLAASQIVARLDGLAPAELDLIAAYERSGRARRTILSKVARLQQAS